jgi:hypothetical protein
MAGLVPAIHALLLSGRKKDVDARDKRGHDEDTTRQRKVLWNSTAAAAAAILIAGGASCRGSPNNLGGLHE